MPTDTMQSAAGASNSNGPHHATNRVHSPADSTPSKAKGPDATRHFDFTNEIVHEGIKSGKHNHCNVATGLWDDLRNELKHSLLAGIPVDVDAVGGYPVLPTDSAANDLIDEDLPEAAIEPPAPSVLPMLRYKLLTDDDLRLLPPVEWLIKGVLPSQGVAVVFGPSGSAKSFLVLDMLLSLALGREWFGRKVKSCSVTYIALEGEAGLSGRVEAYRLHHGSTSRNIRYMAQPFRLLDADDINDLALAIKSAGTGDVVVLDTLSRATPGSDENDSKAMGLIIDSAKMLQEQLGGLVLFVHHTGKDASRGMRGHSSLHAALDCAIEVKRNGDHREWLVAKSKDGEDGESHSFKLEVVPLGIDSDGEAITSCVIVRDQSAQTAVKKMATLGSNQTIALKALKEELCRSMDIDKDGAPPVRPCLRLEHALAIISPLMPAETKHKKERAKDALTGLMSKSIVGVKGDWLWCN